MKNAKWRLNLVLAGVGLLAMLVSSGLLYASLRSQAYEEVRKESVRQMATAQAVRTYTNDYVRDLLMRDLSTFHSPSVPSFSAITTMRYLQATYPGYRYQEVAINPTNPGNRAQGWEREVVESFRRNDDDERFITTGSESGDLTFHYAKPLRVTKAACLQCHGDAASAPKPLLAKYGPRGGFGWRVGEVVGAQIVSVPASAALSKVKSTFFYYLFASCALMSSFFFVLNWMLSKTVLKPIVSSNDKLLKLVSEDSLTGVANRRAFSMRLEDDIQRANLTGSPLSVVMIDLDHFKKVNDSYGHSVGDAVLKECCGRISHKIRRTDLLGRLGGEEFAILLPATDEAGALQLATHLLAAISAEPMGVAGTVTASLGVAQMQQDETAAHLLERADAALYCAKREGRNRAVRARPSL